MVVPPLPELTERRLVATAVKCWMRMLPLDVSTSEASHIPLCKSKSITHFFKHCLEPFYFPQEWVNGAITQMTNTFVSSNEQVSMLHRINSWSLEIVILYRNRKLEILKKIREEPLQTQLVSYTVVTGKIEPHWLYCCEMWRVNVYLVKRHKWPSHTIMIRRRDSLH